MSFKFKKVYPMRSINDPPKLTGMQTPNSIHFNFGEKVVIKNEDNNNSRIASANKYGDMMSTNDRRVFEESNAFIRELENEFNIVKDDSKDDLVNLINKEQMKKINRSKTQKVDNIIKHQLSRAKTANIINNPQKYSYKIPEIDMKSTLFLSEFVKKYVVDNELDDLSKFYEKQLRRKRKIQRRNTLFQVKRTNKFIMKVREIIKNIRFKRDKAAAAALKSKFIGKRSCEMVNDNAVLDSQANKDLTKRIPDDGYPTFSLSKRGNNKSIDDTEIRNESIMHNLLENSLVQNGIEENNYTNNALLDHGAKDSTSSPQKVIASNSYERKLKQTKSKSLLTTYEQKNMNLTSLLNVIFKNKQGKYELKANGILNGKSQNEVILNTFEFDVDEEFEKVYANNQNNDIDEAHQNYLKNETKIDDHIYKILKTGLEYFNDFFQAFISVLACFIYILTTYHDENDHGPYAKFLEYIELIIAGIFAVDYIHHIYHTKNRLKFIISLNSIIDLVIIISTCIAHFLKLPSLGYLHTFSIFRVLRIIKIYRLFKAPKQGEKINKNLSNSAFSLHKQIGLFICTIFVLAFVSAGISYEGNKMFNGKNYQMIIKEDDSWAITDEQEQYTFFTALYLIFQQMLLLNFGDIKPITASSRIIMGCFIALTIVIIIDQFMQLVEGYRGTSPWDFDYQESEHFAILGDFNDYSIWKVLSQLYVEDKDMDDKHTLIIRDNQPSLTLLNIVDGLNLKHLVKYMECSIYDESIIEKAKLSNASDIIILSNQSSQNPTKTDDYAILALKLVQDYAPMTKKYVQVIRLEALKEINTILNHVPWSFSVCTSLLKGILMAESIFIKGILTFFGNLFTIYSREVKSETSDPWLLEYNQSFKQEMYAVEISNDLHELEFSEVTRKIYKVSTLQLKTQGILMIGIKRISMDEHKKVEILINPMNYKIHPQDKGIVLADTYENAKILSTYKEKKIGNESENEVFSLTLKPVLCDSQVDIKEAFMECLSQSLFATPNPSYSTSFSKKYVDLSLDDISEDISDHIIILSPIEIYEQCIIAIRQRTNQPILILSEQNPDYTWEVISSKFTNIIYAKGNMMCIEHLEKIGLRKAYHVLIYKIRSSNNPNSDANSLLFANLIDEFYNVPYTIELAEQESIRYLKSNSSEHHKDLRFQKWPKYLGGNVFFSCILDSLMAMIHHNSTIYEVFQHIYSNYRHQFNSTDNPNVDNIHHQTKKIIENKQIQLVEVTQNIEGSTYSTMVEAFLAMEHPVLPIALYTSRYCQPASSNGFTRKSIYQLTSAIDCPILLTNPVPTTRLVKGDKILVFGSNLPSEKPTYKPDSSLALFENYTKKVPYDDHELQNLYAIHVKKAIGIDMNNAKFACEKDLQKFPLLRRLHLGFNCEEELNEKQTLIDALNQKIYSLKIDDNLTFYD